MAVPSRGAGRGVRSFAGAPAPAPGSKPPSRVTALGPQSGLRWEGDAIVAQQPRDEAPDATIADNVFKQLFGTKSPVRAQKTRRLDPKSGRHVAGTSEEVPRNRPDFILQAMLSEDPSVRSMVKDAWDRASDSQREILTQEIAEVFPDVQGRAPGGSPLYREVMTFLRTGEVSPERMDALRAEAQVSGSDPRVARDRRALPPGHPDRQAVQEDFDALDQPVELESAGINERVPGDPLLDAGARAFPAPAGVDATHLRDGLDARPYLRTQEEISARGDKINPRKGERFDTILVETKDAPAAGDMPRDAGDGPQRDHLESMLIGRGLMPESSRGRLAIDFMENVLRNRGIDPTYTPPEPEPAPTVQVPVRIPQGKGAIGPQDAGRILAGEKYEKADAARVARMEQAIADDFGMDIQDVRAERAQLVAVGNRDAVSQLDARAKAAIEDAHLGPYPEKPYDSASRESDLRAASSVAPGGEQGLLADALDQLGRGQRGAEDRVFRMLLRKDSRNLQSPSQAGIPNAEAMADYALSLITNRDVLGRIAANKGFDTWRQGIVDALNDRFYRQDAPPLVRTPEEVARLDAEIDAASSPEGVSQGPQVGPDAGGNAGALGEPQSLRASQAADAYPQGVDQYGRPVSAIEGRNPTGGRKSPGHVNSPVDRYPGSEGTENLSRAAENVGQRPTAGVPISPERDAGVLDTQAAALQNSIDYAHQRGKVVWQDPETGDMMAAYITDRMDPVKIEQIRENARWNAPSSDEVFDYYWPNPHQPPQPSFFKWQMGQAADEVPDSYRPPSSTQPTRAPQEEIDDTLNELRAADEARLEADRRHYGEFGITGEKPPGWYRDPGGRLRRYGFNFNEDQDPNDLLAELGEVYEGIFDGPQPARSGDEGAEAWEQAGRLVRDSNGDAVPESGASADELASEVVRILEDDDASPEDLAWAREVSNGLRDEYNELPDEGIREDLRQSVIEPIEAAAFARQSRSSPQPVGEEDAPVITSAPEASVDQVAADLDAAATPIATEPEAPLPPQAATPAAQPSVQSADNAKPQEPPKPVENAARQNADAQKAASDAEAEAADAVAKADAEQQPPQGGEAVPRTEVPEPAQPAPGWMKRFGSHVYKNKGRYMLGAGAAGVAAAIHQGSMPAPGALPFPEAGSGAMPGPAPAAPAQPEDRIRAMRNGGYEYPRQTLWRLW